jgi:hypothetical protein
MYYQLTDSDTGEDLGIVRVSNHVDGVANMDDEINIIDPDQEVRDSWEEFHILQEHELDNCDVEEFVDWHNENRVTQIERIYLETL